MSAEARGFAFKHANDCEHAHEPSSGAMLVTLRCGCLNVGPIDLEGASVEQREAEAMLSHAAARFSHVHAEHPTTTVYVHDLVTILEPLELVMERMAELHGDDDGTVEHAMRAMVRLGIAALSPEQRAEGELEAIAKGVALVPSCEDGEL